MVIELGQKVKCVVTGFTGIATARIEYLNGCMQILVSPKMAVPKKGETQEYPTATYVDVEQLIVVKATKIKLTERKDPSGGVRQHP